MCSSLVKPHAKRRRRRRKPTSPGKGLAPSLAALTEAEGYELPFGRWKGYGLAQVAERDAGYLDWLAREVEGVAGLMARTYLAGQGTR